MNRAASVLHQLMDVIHDRRTNPPPRSYTSQLFAGGTQAIGAKIVEEAGELVEAGEGPEDEAGQRHLVHEAADLVYHVMVLLAHRGLNWDDVEQELKGRFGISGLDEKESRRKPAGPEA